MSERSEVMPVGQPQDETLTPEVEDQRRRHLVLDPRDPLETDRYVLDPLFRTRKRFWLAFVILGGLVILLFTTWGFQMYWGLGITGLNRPVMWALYIVNFVYFIGIGHAGTFLSAALRVLKVEWRRPISRAAELVTVAALLTALLFAVLHLGRPWKVLWLLPYPNARQIWPSYHSPLMWDLTAVFTYLSCSVLFAFIGLLPDLAMARDHSAGWRHTLYKSLALGWRGTEKEWANQETALNIFCYAIIPVMFSVHTIVSWDFAMAPVPMWHSTIFGPYFVAGAIFSGIAALIIAMAALRKLLHLEDYLTHVHFDNLGKLLLLMTLLWGYFVFAERLTVWYGNGPAENTVLWATQGGPYAILFWVMVICNFIIPFPILAIKKLRTITGTVIASFTIVVGMWLERYLIIVPSLARKYLPYSWGSYWPKWPEITITVGTFAGMALLYLLFTKVVPIISMWELKAGQRHRPEASAAPQVGGE